MPWERLGHFPAPSWCNTVLQVYKSAGPKWQLANELYKKPEWAELTQGVKAIMVADDDLEMDTCILNRCAGRPAWGAALRCAMAWHSMA
jgi:hypothetical protein